jgi:hypothetical protein
MKIDPLIAFLMSPYSNPLLADINFKLQVIQNMDSHVKSGQHATKLYHHTYSSSCSDFHQLTQEGYAPILHTK